MLGRTRRSHYCDLPLRGMRRSLHNLKEEVFLITVRSFVTHIYPLGNVTNTHVSRASTSAANKKHKTKCGHLDSFYSCHLISHQSNHQQTQSRRRKACHFLHRRIFRSSATENRDCTALVLSGTSYKIWEARRRVVWIRERRAEM